MNGNVFRLETPCATAPQPIEVAVYAYQTWLWDNCRMATLASDWEIIALWTKHASRLIEWFVSLSPEQRRTYTPWFMDESDLEHWDQVWIGWIHNGVCMQHRAIPRTDAGFQKARLISPERLERNDWSFTNEQCPFLGGFDVRNDRWYLLASAAAFWEAHRQGENWWEPLLSNPAEAVRWFASLDERDRDRVAVNLVWKDPLHREHSQVFYYEAGKARQELLPDRDERVKRGRDRWSMTSLCKRMTEA